MRAVGRGRVFVESFAFKDCGFWEEDVVNVSFPLEEFNLALIISDSTLGKRIFVNASATLVPIAAP